MALILKFKKFHFGIADMENKEEKKENILCVSHDICRHHHLGLPAVILKSDGWLTVLSSLWNSLDNSSNLSDIHTSIDLRAAFTQKSQVISYKNYNS